MGTRGAARVANYHIKTKFGFRVELRDSPYIPGSHSVECNFISRARVPRQDGRALSLLR